MKSINAFALAVSLNPVRSCTSAAVGFQLISSASAAAFGLVPVGSAGWALILVGTVGLTVLGWVATACAGGGEPVWSSKSRAGWKVRSSVDSGIALAFAVAVRPVWHRWVSSASCVMLGVIA